MYAIIKLSSRERTKKKRKEEKKNGKRKTYL